MSFHIRYYLPWLMHSLLILILLEVCIAQYFLSLCTSSSAHPGTYLWVSILILEIHYPTNMMVTLISSFHPGTNSIICLLLGQALETHKHELAQHFQVETDCVLKDTMKNESCSTKVHNQLMATVVIIVGKPNNPTFSVE